jgi:transposase
MFSLGERDRYYLYSEPTDMRKSFYTLSGIVNNVIGSDSRNGDVYIFVNHRRNRMKLLHHETGGMVIYSKMLDSGTFGMPVRDERNGSSIEMEWEELRVMVEGIMRNSGSRQARQKRLQNMWKK